MQTLSEFFREVYVPRHLRDADLRTISAYQGTITLVDEILDTPTIVEINMMRHTFISKLRKQKAAPATIAKHIRHLNAVFAKIPVKDKNRGADATPLYWKNIPVPDKEPKIVTDSDFQGLYRAFGSETEFPRHLPVSLRPHYWRTMMVFVSVTALRREAVLGVEFRDVYFFLGFANNVHVRNVSFWIR